MCLNMMLPIYFSVWLSVQHNCQDSDSSEENESDSEEEVDTDEDVD